VGCRFAVLALDGQALFIGCTEILNSSYKKGIDGEGTPKYYGITGKGDLILHFHVLFKKTWQKIKRKIVGNLLQLLKQNLCTRAHCLIRVLSAMILPLSKSVFSIKLTCIRNN